MRKTNIAERMQRLRILWFAVACFVATGCQDESESVATQANGNSLAATSPRPKATGPSKVELTDATAKLDELGIVRFDIHYEFTSGGPTKFYQCDITFIDADRYGIKPMMADELAQSGSFKTGIEVEDAPVKEYEITLSEAESPDQGYRLISNTLRGEVDVRKD